MLQIIVKVTGLDQAEARLTRLGESLHNFTAAFEGLGKTLIMFFSDTVFVSRGQALGHSWEPLKEATQIEKDKHWRGAQWLVRSGDMQRGFTSEVTPVSLFIGNKMPYFPFHQLGTSAGAGRGHNIPARPMLGANATVESMIKVAIEADIRAKIDASKV